MQPPAGGVSEQERQLCVARLFELFPELPRREVEDCYLRSGRVLRVTYQLLLEALAGSSTTVEGGACSSPAAAHQELADLAAETQRAEREGLAARAAAELAGARALLAEERAAEAERGREAAESGLAEDRRRRGEVGLELEQYKAEALRLTRQLDERRRVAAEAQRLAAHAAAGTAETTQLEALTTLKATVASRARTVAALEASVAAAHQELADLAAETQRAEREGLAARAAAELAGAWVADGEDEAAALLQVAAGEEALWAAAQDGETAEVRVLLAAGANPDAVDWTGDTALIKAARWGHEDVVGALVEGDADLDKADKNGATALMIAAYRGRSGAVRRVLELGADHTAVGTGGWAKGKTALELAEAPARPGKEEAAAVLREWAASH
eukprot:COSAG04_NODE_550_length_12709_cov_6.177637_10_plen_388_part_00